MSLSTSTPPLALRRQLGLLAVTALVVGEVIAIGIFLTPAGMARSLGSPFWLLIVWLLMGAMALSGALCYGELAARAPEAGGGYVYLRKAYGPAVAFLYGWKCMLVMDPGITAALAVGLASYVGYALGLAGVSLKLIAIATILALAAVNVAGLRLGSRLMQWLTALKLGALGLIAILAFALRAGSWSNFVPFVAQHAGSDPLPMALAAGLVGAFFAFGGWWEISKLAGEARDPAPGGAGRAGGEGSAGSSPRGTAGVQGARKCAETLAETPRYYGKGPELSRLKGAGNPQRRDAEARSAGGKLV